MQITLKKIKIWQIIWNQDAWFFFQSYPEFLIFYLPDYYFSGYGHCHISDSLNFIKNIFQIFFFCPAILIYVFLQNKQLLQSALQSNCFTFNQLCTYWLSCY